MSQSAPVYRFQNGSWHLDPDITLYGEKQFGGPLAALLGQCMVETCPALAARLCLNFSLHLLRPTPAAPLQVWAAPLRIGGRLAIVDAWAEVGGERTARATGVFATPQAMSRLGTPAACQRPAHMPPLPQIPPEPVGPSGLILRRGVMKDGKAWLGLARPVTEAPLPAFARAAAIADWAPAVLLPRETDDPPAFRFPNVDLCLSFTRPMSGTFLGLAVNGHWDAARGLGQSDMALFDEAGYLGHATQSMIMWDL